MKGNKKREKRYMLPISAMGNFTRIVFTFSRKSFVNDTKNTGFI